MSLTNEVRTLNGPLVGFTRLFQRLPLLLATARHMIGSLLISVLRDSFCEEVKTVSPLPLIVHCHEKNCSLTISRRFPN